MDITEAREHSATNGARNRSRDLLDDVIETECSLDNRCADIINYERYYKNGKYDINKDFNEAYDKYNDFTLGFPEDLQILMFNEKIEAEILDKLEINNIESLIDEILTYFAKDSDNIKNFILKCLVYVNNQLSKGDLILQLFLKILEKEDSSYSTLFMKSLIESLTFHGMINHKFLFVAANLKKTCYKWLIDRFLTNHDIIIENIRKIEKDSNIYKISLNEYFPGKKSEIQEIIASDNLDKFIEYIYDQKEVKPNPKYENEYNKMIIESIRYAAHSSAIKIFKYLLMCNYPIPENIERHALIGGNIEIIRLLLQKDVRFDGCLEFAIIWHRNEIFKWLFECNLYNNSLYRYSNLISRSIKERNLEAFLFMINLKPHEIFECFVYEAIMSQSYTIYRILKFLSNNKYFKHELEYAVLLNYQPVIRYIINNNTAEIVESEVLYQLMIQILPFNEIKAIVSHLQQDNFMHNITKYWSKSMKISLNTINNLIKFNVDINLIKIEYKSSHISLLGHTITYNDQNRMFKLLLQYPGVDVNVGECPPIEVASIERRAEALALLFGHPNIVFRNKFKIFKDSHHYYCYVNRIDKKSFFDELEAYKSILSANGASLLAMAAITNELRAFKEMINRNFPYINKNHISILNFYQDQDLPLEYKAKMLKLDGFSALDISEDGSNLQAFNLELAEDLINLKDLNVNSLIDTLVNNVYGDKIHDEALRHLSLAIDHPNFSIEIGINLFMEKIIDRREQSIEIRDILYEKFKKIIQSDQIRSQTIISFINNFQSTTNDVIYANFKFVLKENLFFYDQFVRYYRDLVNLFIEPERIEYLLSIVNDDDFEACALMSLDEVMKRIERGKIDDISKYFFMFCFKNVCYDKMSIISRIVLLSDIKISVYLLSFISRRTDIDPNYFDFNRSENPPLHLAIIQNKSIVALRLLLFDNIDISLKNCNGLTPIDLCKQTKNQKLYDIIEFSLESRNTFLHIANCMKQFDIIT